MQYVLSSSAHQPPSKKLVFPTAAENLALLPALPLLTVATAPKLSPSKLADGIFWDPPPSFSFP